MITLRSEENRKGKDGDSMPHDRCRGAEEQRSNAVWMLKGICWTEEKTLLYSGRHHPRTNIESFMDDEPTNPFADFFWAIVNWKNLLIIAGTTGLGWLILDAHYWMAGFFLDWGLF